MIKVNCLSLKSITREYNYKLYYISSISFNFRPYSPIFDCILPALSTRVFGGVLDGKKTRLKTTGQPTQAENIFPTLVVLSFLDVSFFPSRTAPLSSKKFNQYGRKSKEIEEI